MDCCPGFFRVRILVGFLMFMGTMTSYMLRVNLNLAIVQMTDDTEGQCTNKTSNSARLVPSIEEGLSSGGGCQLILDQLAQGRGVLSSGFL